MQFFKTENYFEVRDALRSAGRTDLIGDGCDCLIPSAPPREAVQRRRQDANARFRGEYVHTIPGTSNSDATSAAAGTGKKRKRQRRSRSSDGYRPGRKGAQ